MNNSKDHFFLDTSTQINRGWADEEIKNKIRADLFKKKLRCSIYVEREYRARVLNTLINIYNILRKSEDIEVAKKRTEKLKQEGIFDTLTCNVIRRLYNRFNSIKTITRRLRSLIEGTWENFFYDGGIPRALADMTGCTRGAEVPQQLPQGYYLSISTHKCPENCKISDFWESKQEDLQNLASVDTAVLTRINDPKGTINKIQEEAKAILVGESPYGGPCRTVSDAVISIEARDSYPGITIHTMDHDFELLKKLLNTKVRFFKF